jgi:hypothetical protein
MTVEYLKKIQDMLKLINDNIDLTSTNSDELLSIVDELKVIKRLCNKSIIDIENKVIEQIELSPNDKVRFGSFNFTTQTKKQEYKALVRIQD